MSNETRPLSEALLNYLRSVSVREHPVLYTLRNSTAALSMGHMQISPEQGQLMALLVAMLNAKKTLDIGTFTGYSALVVALALPPGGKVISCDIDKICTDQAKRAWVEAGVEDRIELRLAPALNTLQSLIDQGESSTFDFIFIDADKNNYMAYYEKALMLLRPGGLIAIDNVLWSGKVADESIQDETTNNLRKLNAHLHQDKRVRLSLIPIGDGLSLAQKC